jgi:CheY-like chemotaxis protein
MKTIAVVDDNPDNVLLLEALLQDFYNTIAYTNGEEALAGIKDSLPDLVLLDISLPNMDGTEVLKKIRQDEKTRHLPVIALTAHAMKGDEENYIKMGFNDYIAKPILDHNQLMQKIAEYLSTKTNL